jgi:hypothetical protein
MISPHKSLRKKVDKLVNAAERLAAVQYEAGLKATEPAKRQKVQKKVDKCWTEFRIACDVLLDNYAESHGIIIRWSR